MEISRSALLAYAVGAAEPLGLSRAQVGRVRRALAGAGSPPVLWLSSPACAACCMSQLNAAGPSADPVLLNPENAKCRRTGMPAPGELAVAAATSTDQAGGHILVVEGAIPVSLDGRGCSVWAEGDQSVTMARAVNSLAASATCVVAVGTCAVFGEVSGARCGSTAMAVGGFLGRQVVNLPGCPVHADRVVGSLVQILSGTMVSLDSHGRPAALYSTRLPSHTYSSPSETERLIAT